MTPLVAIALLTAAAAVPDRAFPPDAVIDVTRPPYSAVPNDGRDDAPAIQRAISDCVDSGRSVFLPAGVYDLSSGLAATNAAGVWRAHLTVRGAGRDRTVLRLADGAAGFGGFAVPRAVLTTASHWQPGDAADGGGNKAFRNNLYDLTIETGRANPAAIGIAYAVSNVGSIENVTVRDTDGQAFAGIALTRRIPGPGYVHGVTIDGFAVGLDLGDIQYGLTIDDLTVRNQRLAGVRVRGNALHVRRLLSANRVPAVQVTDPAGMLTLLDSRLEGGAPDAPAIECAGTCLLRNVIIGGYAPGAAIRCGDRVFGRAAGAGLAWPLPAGPLATSRPVADRLLPIEEPPSWNGDDPADWAAVGPRLPGEPDDTAAIQRALDSGHATVYLPASRTCYLSDTLVIRGAVRRLVGTGAELNLGAAREPFGDPAHPRPLIRIDPTDADVVFIESVFFNAQYPGALVFENNTPATLVIRHCGGWVGADGHRRSYRNTARATGRVFLEDVYLPGWTFTRQSVWARQFNPENWDGDGSEPQVLNDGGSLWVLGFKTEGPAPFIATRNGGITELLGAYNYVSATKTETVPAASIPYPVDNARAALTFVSDNFRESHYAVCVLHACAGRTNAWRNADLPRGARPGDRSRAVPLLRCGVPETPL